MKKFSNDSEGYANSHLQVSSVVILLLKNQVKRHKREEKHGVYDYDKGSLNVVTLDIDIP